MFRRFRFLVGLFAIVVVTAIAGGSAYFYFGGSKKDDATIENKVETSEDGNNISADNIFENYEFGADKNLNETYTYYFFPSTLYMELYNNGYSEPEKVFGYNEVVLDDSGDPVLTSDGQPTYEIVKEGSSGMHEYDSYYDYLVNVLNSNSDYYLYSNGLNLENYSYDVQNLNSQIFSFGNGLPGDDYNVSGPNNNFRINNIYELNNKGAKFILDTLDISSYNINEIPQDNDAWRYVNYTFGYDNKFAYNKSNEVLSPIYGDNDFSIDLRLNGSKNSIYGIYFNFFSNSTNIEISKNSINGNINYLNSPHGINTNNHSLFYVKNNNPKHKADFDVYNYGTYLNNHFVGTWVIDDNTRLVVHEAGEDGSGTGLLSYLNRYWNWIGWEYEWHFDTFEYQLSENNLNLQFWGTNGSNISGNINLSNSEFDDPFLSPINGRAQYRNDRFGFWTSFYDWDDPNNSSQARPQNTASRYLPIKITVNGNLTPDDMAKVIPSVSASTFDDHYWFDYTSNVWTYTKANTTTEYTTAVGGFTAKDITNIFDIMQNPSKYADNNVIRLYPVFSNGKNAGSHDPTNGGSDGIKAEFKYKEGATPTINNSLLPDQTKLTYAGGSGNTYKYGSDYNLNYAILKNVELVKYRYESIVFRAATTASPGGWGDNWTEIYKLNSNAIDDFVGRYGAGLYTIYLFIGGRATKVDQGPTPFLGTNIINHVTKEDSEAGNDLKDKHLMSIYDNGDKMFVGTGNDGFKYIKGGDNIGDQARPVGLTIEKVTNFRLVTDIPIIEENGKPSNNQNWGEIDESVHQGLLHAENFIMADSVYKLSEKEFKTEDLTLDKITGNDRLDSDNPYIYVIQNADFRFVNNLYFQIRFSNDYIKDALEVRTNYANVPQGTAQYVAYEINGQLIKFQFQSGDEIFIDNVGPVGSGDTARSGFKLRDYNARGIYDILLVSTKDTSGISSKHTLNMYINRHTNSFIKLFKGNPGTFEYKDPEVIDSTFGTDFVRHKLPSEDDTAEDGQSRVNGSTLLWNGHTYLGEYLATNTSGIAYTRSESDEEEKESGLSTFFEAVKNCLGITPGNDLIYPIIDAVTGKAIAYYNSGVGRIFTDSGSTGGGDNSSIDLFNIMKNYVLYIPVA